MNELSWVKIAADAGLAGVVVVAMFLFYRLADKYGAAFLGAQEGLAKAMGEQAAAMSSLAAAVKEGQSDQREVLIAVRVLADRMELQKDYLEAIERMVREKGMVASA